MITILVIAMIAAFIYGSGMLDKPRSGSDGEG